MIDFYAASSSCRTGFSEVAVLTIGGTAWKRYPSGRYDSTQNYAARARGVIFCPRALDNIANLHMDGQATSQRLQLMQYFSASSSVRHLSNADARHPARLVLALITGIHPAHRAGGGADGALNAFSKLVSFIVGLLRVGQSVERM